MDIESVKMTRENGHQDVERIELMSCHPIDGNAGPDDDVLEPGSCDTEIYQLEEVQQSKGDTEETRQAKTEDNIDMDTATKQKRQPSAGASETEKCDVGKSVETSKHKQCKYLQILTSLCFQSLLYQG